MKKAIDEDKRTVFFFSDKLWVDFNSYLLFEDGIETGKFTDKEGTFLKLLVENANLYVNQEKIFFTLWGFDEEGGPNDVYQAIRDLAHRVRKKHVYFRENIDNGPQRGSWKICVNKKYVERYKREYGTSAYELIGDVTCANIQGISGDNLLFRTREISDIKKAIEKGAAAIVLSGMGGVGKTSIARHIFGELKDKYDCYGWINYSNNTKESFVRSIKINDERYASIEESKIDDKWVYLRKLITGSKERKLFVLDNVDYIFDNNNPQNPYKDADLMGLSGWSNMTCIITTRLPYLEGITDVVRINNLGDKDDFSRCIELFYHFNSAAATHRDSNEKMVGELCAIAHYNTLVIELIAKLCKRICADGIPSYRDLYNWRIIGDSEYIEEIPVSTEHDLTKNIDADKVVYNLGEETIISQIIKLFNLSDRSDDEKLIAWYFANLPEMMVVSREELKKWMGFSLKEINMLVDEGWLESDGNGFWLHPLIRQAIQLDSGNHHKIFELSEEREKINKYLMELLLKETFFEEDEPLSTTVRKMHFVDAITGKGANLSVQSLIYIADFARHAGLAKRAYIYYLEAMYGSRKNKITDYDSLMLQWRSIYYCGCYEMNEEYLREALGIIKGCLDKKQKDNRELLMLAKNYEMLGGCISKNLYKRIDIISEADFFLENAFSIFRKLLGMYADDSEILHYYALCLDIYGNMYNGINPERVLYSCDSKERHYPLLSHNDIVKKCERALMALDEALEVKKRIGEESAFTD